MKRRNMYRGGRDGRGSPVLGSSGPTADEDDHRKLRRTGPYVRPIRSGRGGGLGVEFGVELGLDELLGVLEVVSELPLVVARGDWFGEALEE